eukprot:7089217-Prymnesium_polylepis.1
MRATHHLRPAHVLRMCHRRTVRMGYASCASGVRAERPPGPPAVTARGSGHAARPELACAGAW